MILFRCVVVAAIPWMMGCNFLQSKEDACLQSARLEMKDPESAKVVQNLGDRGLASLLGPEGFWLRYSATNSFGARVSSNMACEKIEGKWARSARMERIALEQVSTYSVLAGLTRETSKLEQQIEARRACKTEACRAEIAAKAGSPDPTGDRAIGRVGVAADAAAKEAVFQGIGPLKVE